MKQERNERTLYGMLKSALKSQSKPLIKMLLETYQRNGNGDFFVSETEYQREMKKRITSDKWNIETLLKTFSHDYDYYLAEMYTRGKKLDNIIGKEKGTLKVIGISQVKEYYYKNKKGERANNTVAIVQCQTEKGGCGGYYAIRAKEINQIESGNISCGCVKSDGERLLMLLFRSLGIGFETQVTYPDMTGINGGYLKTDFEIYSDFVFGLEFDGIQHEKVTGGYMTPEKKKEQDENRKLKIAYYQKIGKPLAMIKDKKQIVPEIISPEYITRNNLWLVKP